MRVTDEYQPGDGVGPNFCGELGADCGQVREMRAQVDASEENARLALDRVARLTEANEKLKAEVERVKELLRLEAERSKENLSCYRDEVERLERELAAERAEDACINCHDAIEKRAAKEKAVLREQLAAAQADAARMREAYRLSIKKCRELLAKSWGSVDSILWEQEAALAEPAQDKPHVMAAEMLAAAASTGHKGTVELAAQLAGIPACPKCGFVKQHCRCKPAQPSRGGCDACGGDKVVHLDGGKCRQDDCALPHKPCPKCGKE